MVNEMKTIRPKLEQFYASLGDEQKARFNAMGPPPQKAQHQRSGTTVEAEPQEPPKSAVRSLSEE
jgi:hypothetical protein